MSKFFCSMIEYNLFEEWASILDWIIDDDKFSTDRRWERSCVSAFTKEAKKLLNPKNKRKSEIYRFDSINNLKFPRRSCSTFKFIHSNGELEGRCIVRHIRNGIAHGNAKIENKNSKLYIEIKDFNSSKKQKQQTAYIFMPLDYINKIYKCYKDVEKLKNKKKNLSKARKRGTQK